MFTLIDYVSKDYSSSLDLNKAFGGSCKQLRINKRNLLVLCYSKLEPLFPNINITLWT